MLKKRIDQKFNFKTYDVTAWLTNNDNKHIAQYLTKQKQPDSETWSVSRINQEIYFSSKIMKKIMQRD